MFSFFYETNFVTLTERFTDSDKLTLVKLGYDGLVSSQFLIQF